MSASTPGSTPTLSNREPRRPRSELVLIVGWLLVIVKGIAVHWACRAYAVPIDPWWIIGPTLLFATLCTWLYCRRD